MQLNGTFDVKLGKSFLDRDSTSYMTMRCDFMPASVDRSQPGSIKVNESKEVVVSLPNVTNSGPDTATLFRGTARPVQKECILIYNKKTHELTLERIAHTVQLKKTREERKADTTCPTNSEMPQFQSLASRSEQDLKSIRPSPTKRKSNDPEISTSSSIVQQPTQKKPPHSRTLSSSSSSSSSNSGTSSSSCDMDIETSESDSDSSSESDSNSSLSSLSNDRNKTSKAKPSSNGKTTTKTVNATNLAAHRKLIEHDLKLSDSDSDSCA
ncbi:unnamed protein product [Schistosoma margrebowiei]|uniref:EAF domain-containing protein n=1 Tax=Schistosoma margrebowiei TaxID=48269 RepID=A0A183LQS3_9TREM|nr:unnamed protein product [Schistosoma margrebowiei]VDO69631.1 unnamed protein product [Schistosoma margrebowiei]